VYECGLYGPFGMSGISIYNPVNTDGVTTGYKIRIVNNVSHSNYNYFPCECLPGKVTDGNGIILDDFKNSQRAAGDPLKDVVYTGKTLVANNIVYNNGGSGIHTFKGVNTDIVNNTAYRNGRHPDLDGEIFANNSEGIVITNNILYGRTGEAVSHDFGNNTNVVMDYNLYYDGTLAPKLDGVTVAANSRVADPLFVNAPDPAAATPADFTLQPGSPAVNAGTDANAPAVDFAGTPRPAGGRSDIGAYEWVAPPLRTPENPTGATAGVNYAYYRGTWTALPNFGTLKPAKTGTLNNFLLAAPKQDKKFAFRYTGFVQVPADGVYTFYTTSSDGSRLYVGTTPVVQNDGLHGAQERSGTIGLKAGKHALTVEYFQNEGSKSLAVAYSGPGVAKQSIPDAALFRTATGGKKGARDGQAEAGSPAAALRVFPVPARDYLQVTFWSDAAGQVSLALTDALGRPVGGGTHPVVGGANVLTLPVGHLKRGFYLLSLTGGAQRRAAKVVLAD
jgi:parallel beta-helix repeat protein